MLLSVLLVVLSLVGVVMGQPVSVSTAMSQAALNDVTTLNYALTLENLESNFYQQGLALFPGASYFQNVSSAVPNGTVVYQYLQLIALHEASHVSFLTTAINSVVPGAAVPNCTYAFTAAGAFASPLAFLTTAALLENTGQTAYDGALDAITTPAYAQVAAQIVTVEGRHAAFLNLLIGAVPFPQAFDNATLPTIIAAAIKPLLVSCPYNITLPQVRPTGVALNATNGVVGTGSLNGTFGYSTAQKLNDITALNYALTLENFEAAFYNITLTTFGAAAFAAAGQPSYVFPYLQLIAAHEALHAATLSMVIAGRGGLPVPVCAYNFSSVTSVAALLATAGVLENTGVMAYDGAANSITDTALQTVAAQIATVESRHASFLNLLNGAVPFPMVQDNGTAPSLIIAAVVATGFIKCGYTPVGPVVISAFANAQAATVSGDPSFVGFHAQAFQVHGIPSRHFALLTAPDMLVSATFVMLEEGEVASAGDMKAMRLMREVQVAAGRKTSMTIHHPLPLTIAASHAGTFLGQVAVQLAGVHRVLAVAGAYRTGMATLQLDGVDVPVSSTPMALSVSGYYLTHSTPHTLTIDTPLLSFTLTNSDRFFNLDQATLNAHYTDDMQLDGLLGQTANPAWKVESSQAFKQHMLYDYLLAADDVFSTDFVNNLYQAKKQ